MAKPFDASLNQLIDERPQEWATFLAERAGVPDGPAVVLDTDLSTTLQPDKLFRVDGPSPAVLHLELEVNSRLGIPLDLLRYNVVTHHLLRIPVHSVLVLLRPKANASDQTGEWLVPGADGRTYLTFRYSIVRVWQESMETFLRGGVTISPLAVVTNEAAADVEAAYRTVDRHLRHSNLPEHVRKKLMGTAVILGGLRYDKDQLREINMSLGSILRESSIVVDFMEESKAEGKAEGMAEGKEEALRSLILRLGRRRLGPMEPEIEALLIGIDDVSRLERISDHLFDAASWDDLLATL